MGGQQLRVSGGPPARLRSTNGDQRPSQHVEVARAPVVHAPLSGPSILTLGRAAIGARPLSVSRVIFSTSWGSGRRRSASEEGDFWCLAAACVLRAAECSPWSASSSSSRDPRRAISSHLQQFIQPSATIAIHLPRHQRQPSPPDMQSMTAIVALAGLAANSAAPPPTCDAVGSLRSPLKRAGDQPSHAQCGRP